MKCTTKKETKCATKINTEYLNESKELTRSLMFLARLAPPKQSHILALSEKKLFKPTVNHLLSIICH